MPTSQWVGLALFTGLAFATIISQAVSGGGSEKEPGGSKTQTSELSAVTFATEPTDPERSALAIARVSAEGTRTLDTRPGWSAQESDRSPVVYVRDKIAGRTDIKLSVDFTYTTTDAKITSVEVTLAATGLLGPLRSIAEAKATVIPNVKTAITCNAAAAPAQSIALGADTQEFEWTISITANGAVESATASTRCTVHVLESTPIAPFSLDPSEKEHLLSGDIVSLADEAWRLRGTAFAERVARFIDADAEGISRFKASTSADGAVTEHYSSGAGGLEDDFTFSLDEMAAAAIAAKTKQVACGPCDAALFAATLARTQGYRVGICAFGSYEDIEGEAEAALVCAKGVLAGTVFVADWTLLDHYYAPIIWNDTALLNDDMSELYVFDGYFERLVDSTGLSAKAGIPFAPDNSPLVLAPETSDFTSVYYRDHIAPQGAQAAPWMTPVFEWEFGKPDTTAKTTSETADGASAESEPAAVNLLDAAEAGNADLLGGIAYAGGLFAADIARPNFSKYTKDQLKLSGQCTIICHSLSYAFMRNTMVKALNNKATGGTSATLNTTLTHLFSAVIGPQSGLTGKDLSRYQAVQASLSALVAAAKTLRTPIPMKTGKAIAVCATAFLSNLNDALYNLRAGSVASCEWNPSLQDYFDPREWAYVGTSKDKHYSCHLRFCDSLSALRAATKSIATLPTGSPTTGFYLLNQQDGDRLRACKRLSAIPAFAVGKSAENKGTPVLYSSSNKYFQPKGLARTALDVNVVPGKKRQATKVFVLKSDGSGWERI